MIKQDRSELEDSVKSLILDFEQKHPEYEVDLVVTYEFSRVVGGFFPSVEARLILK